MHRVGIIPFALEASTVKILFITSQTRGRWILPKGQIEAGESHLEACQREGFEEAGVKGCVLDDFPLTVVIGKQTEQGLQSVPVTFYPLMVLKRLNRWPEKGLRSRRWIRCREATWEQIPKSREDRAREDSGLNRGRGARGEMRFMRGGDPIPRDPDLRDADAAPDRLDPAPEV